MYLLCKHKKLQALIATLVLKQVKEVSAVMQKCKSKILAYIKNNFDNIKFSYGHILTLQKIKIL